MKTEIVANAAAFTASFLTATRVVTIANIATVGIVETGAGAVVASSVTAIALAPAITSIAAGCAAYYLVKKLMGDK